MTSNVLSNHQTGLRTFLFHKKLVTMYFLLGTGLSSLTVSAAHGAPLADAKDRARWQATAKNVTISRDQWGIPHVQRKTDADGVFGLLYAQAEDDFKRIGNIGNN
ncbi:penicillin acylase family protein [Undibacterium amnicola]|nr:penicillin acylase family protein [Undibacterium amnicola]